MNPIRRRGPIRKRPHIISIIPPALHLQAQSAGRGPTSSASSPLRFTSMGPIRRKGPNIISILAPALYLQGPNPQEAPHH